MRHRRHVRAGHVQLVDAEQRPLRFGHRPAPVLAHEADQQHARAVRIQLEPVGEVLAQYCGGEGAEALAELHLEIELLLHCRRARVGEDRTRAERARPELHPSLVPAECLPCGERTGAGLHELVVIEHGEHGPGIRQAPLDLRLQEGRAEIGPFHGVAPVRRGDARLAEILVPDRQRRAERTARITRRRLDPDLLEDSLARDLAVGHTVQRHAACQAKLALARLCGERAREPEHDLVGDGLDRGGEIHMPPCQ